MRPGLSVEYVVNGTTYKRIVYLRSKDVWTTRDYDAKAKRITEEYEEGMEIPVFYSPSDPSTTVIGGVLGRANL